MQFRRLLILAGVLVLDPLRASAQSATTSDEAAPVQWTTSWTSLHDSNLYRLPDGSTPRALGLGLDSRSDTVGQAELDVDGTLHLGRQQVQLGGGVNRQVYRENPRLDQTYRNGRADWLWQLGNEFHGEVKQTLQESLTSFADFQSGEANRQDLRSGLLSASWQPRPDRRIGLSYQRNGGSNSVLARQGNDFRSSVERVEFGVDSGVGHEIVLGASQTRNEYPNRTIIAYAPIDNSYRQRQVDLSTHIATSGKTGTDLMFGYARRYYADVPDRDFSGPVGSISASWQAGARTGVEMGVARTLDEVLDLFRIFSVTSSAHLNLSYDLTYKIQASLRWSGYRSDYKGDPHNFYTYIYGQAPARVDSYSESGVRLRWLPQYRWQVQLDEVLERRGSTAQGFQYRDLTSTLSLQYKVGG